MQYKLTGNADADRAFFAERVNVQKKLALEWEAKRKAREAAGEPKPVSPYTSEQIAQFREDTARTLRNVNRKRETDMTNTLRHGDHPVEIGMIRYVSSPVAGEGVAACVVTNVLPTERYYDPEHRCYASDYPYHVRRATEAEEREYLALPRATCANYRTAP